MVARGSSGRRGGHTLPGQGRLRRVATIRQHCRPGFLDGRDDGGRGLAIGRLVVAFQAVLEERQRAQAGLDDLRSMRGEATRRGSATGTARRPGPVPRQALQAQASNSGHENAVTSSADRMSSWEVQYSEMIQSAQVHTRDARMDGKVSIRRSTMVSCSFGLVCGRRASSAGAQPCQTPSTRALALPRPSCNPA